MSSVEIQELSKVRLDADDVLVVRVPRGLSAQGFDQVRGVLSDAFPGHRSLILCGDDVLLEVWEPGRARKFLS